MQRFLVLSVTVVIACSDDDGNKTTPDTALVEVPPAITNDKHVRILFEARGNANAFVCTLDGQTSSCISPFEADVDDGEHTFEVAAALNANVDDTPAVHTWTVDTVTPETVLTSAPPALDNSVTPSFEFTGTDSSTLRAAGVLTFECSLDGDPFVACTSPHTPTVVDGAHTFRVRSKDEAGNVDPSPAEHGWTIDATAPETMITGGPAAGDPSGPSGEFTFSSLDADATFECAIDGAAFAACTSPHAFTLGDGAHTFAVRARDMAGIVDPSPAMRTWTVDAIAPPVAITTAPPNPSNDATPMFAFSSTDATATFECQVDGVTTFAACTSPFVAPALADGSRTFRVRATDPVGNVGTADTHTWVVDTVAPTVSLTAQPAALSNDNTPAVSFTTAGAPVAVECAVDGGAFAACTSPFTSAALADGMHTITVRATDAAGNAGSATTSQFVIDTTPPAVTITSQPAALSNDNTPTVTFTTAGSPTSTQCRVDSGTPVACAGSFTATVADGPHTITVRVTDGAGNAASATTNQFVVDTVAPTVSITGEPAALSDDTTPTVTFTTGGNPTVTECQVDSGTFAGCTSPFTPTVADGTHTITVRVRDGAGNIASDTTSSFVVDTLAPTVTLTGQPAALSNDSTPSVTFTTAGSPTTVECRLDTGTFASCTSPFTTTASDGSHTITVRVADGAGNASTATTNMFTIDTVAPTVSITAQPAALSNNNDPSVAFTTGGSPTSTTCRLDTGTPVACSSPHTFTNVADGTHTITVIVADAAGNTASDATTSFVVDTAPPTVTITAQPATLSNNNDPSVAFTAGGSPTTTTCQLDAGTPVTCTSPHQFANVADGTHAITVRVTDGAGNMASATTNMFTIDTIAPTVSITGQPSPLSNNNDPAVVFTTGGSPTTTTCRLDTGTPVACSSPHTFTNVADGTHTITVTVGDAAGNQASATTNQFVVDTVAPVLAFTEQAPASWPVNYFDFRFTVSGATTIQCSLDGAAFAPCTSPHTVTVAYNVSHVLRVQASDAAGNTTTITSASWTPSPGLVLHYPWEQGDTDNTSLLKQRPTHSPDGTTQTISTFVGGWAGSALGSDVSAHQYARTSRPLTSSPDGTYTASFWIRSTDAASAQTIFSTVSGTSGGLRVSLSGGSQLTVTAFENSAMQTSSTSISEDRWAHVALVTTGTGKGLQVFIDGNLRITIPSISGFNAGQATNMTVGSWSGLDVDDLRFFNLALSNAEVCNKLARGFVVAGGACTPLSPGFEIDFEGARIVDTGLWRLDLVAPLSSQGTFGAHTLGNLFRLNTTFDFAYSPNGATTFSKEVAAVPGHSFSFEFIPGTATGTLIDFTRPCNAAGGGGLCGIAVSYANNDLLSIYTGTPSEQKTTTIGTAGGLVPDLFNNVVVTAQRGAQGTTSVTVFVNQKATVIPLAGTADIYAIVSDTVDLVQVPNLVVDEYEFWGTDLSADPELMCENGLDGEFDVVTGSCLLTYGP